MNRIIRGLGSLIILFGLTVFAFQGLRWLSTDYWEEIPLTRILPESYVQAIPQLKWSWLAKTLALVVDQSLALVAILLGLFITLIGVALAHYLREDI